MILPRCARRRCDRIARIQGWCVQHAEKTADELFGQWVRNRDGRCVAQGMWDMECKGYLAAAHLIGRKNHSTRYDPLNVWTLCNNAHHYMIDQHGREAHKQQLALTLMSPNEWASLNARAIPTTKRVDAIEAALAWLTGGGAA